MTAGGNGRGKGEEGGRMKKGVGPAQNGKRREKVFSFAWCIRKKKGNETGLTRVKGRGVEGILPGKGGGGKKKNWEEVEGDERWVKERRRVCPYLCGSLLE